MRKLIATGAILVCLWMVAPLAAAPIPVGTSTGTLAIHYNVGEPETPSEQGYIKSQFSPTNTNGAALASLPPFGAIFGDVGQFGFDLVLEAPTHDGSLDPIPFLTAVDYDGVGPVPAGPVAWAMNDYKPGVPGPGTPGNIPYNSLFRGPGVELSSSLLSVVGTVFTVEVTGKLISDGFIHWFSPGAGTTSIKSTGFRNNFLFSGIFSYDSSTDTTVGIDYYSGTATFFAIPLPEPASVTMLAFGSAFVLAGARFRRNRSAIE